MALTPEQRDKVASELKGFATDLNLSEEPKTEGAWLPHRRLPSKNCRNTSSQNPNASKEDLIKTVADNRAAIRQCLVDVLTPEQLTKWDAAVGRAKEFLGQRTAA